MLYGMFDIKIDVIWELTVFAYLSGKFQTFYGKVFFIWCSLRPTPMNIMFFFIIFLMMKDLKKI